MCESCGCAMTGPAAAGGDHHHPAPDDHRHGVGERDAAGGGRVHVRVMRDLMAANDAEARHNREHFDAHGVFSVNLMSAPGAGKTALLEATIAALAGSLRIAVIEGDLETENDAVRIRARGVPAIQITTGTACHLDAHMVHRALHDLELSRIDLLFIENVGNLVCPAAFDLGQHRNVTLLSVTEGDDKPAKYPVMFRASDAVLISKTDLLPYFEDFDPERAGAHVRRLARSAPVLPISVKTAAGLDPWIAWLMAEREAYRSAAERARDDHDRPRSRRAEAG